MSKKKRYQRKRASLTPPRRSKLGVAPGTLIADDLAPKPVIQAIAFDAQRLEERSIIDVEELRPLLEAYRVTWVNVEGLGGIDVIRRLGEVFGLHPLALEDVVSVHQRPKWEDYTSHQFVVLRMAASWAARLETEQVSIFFGNGFVVTFQEGVAGDAFDPVRQRIRTSAGHLRSAGADYLMYSLIDAVVDHYFPVLESYGERIDAIEDLVISTPTRETLDKLHVIKRDLLSLRKTSWPLRDVVTALGREPNALVTGETRLYLRDVHDHIVQIVDILETYREIASSLMDVFLSSLSNRMNEVMKLLTVIATIFIPLTFIAGVYGMNFDAEASPWNMPELKWRYGYVLSLVAMLLTALCLLYYFKQKGWLGKGLGSENERRRPEASLGVEGRADGSPGAGGA